MNYVLTVSIVMDVNFHFLFSRYRMEQLLKHTHTHTHCGVVSLLFMAQAA